MKPPVDNPRITSPYGRRVLNGKREFHDGIDFVGSSLNVYSIGDGIVHLDYDDYEDKERWTDKKDSAGNYIIIKTKIGKETYFVRYLHLSENYVRHGQEVKAGELVGKYGDVGYSFGAHLHLDMYNDVWIKQDPTNLYNYEG